jgi:hypothetical protein
MVLSIFRLLNCHSDVIAIFSTKVICLALPLHECKVSMQDLEFCESKAICLIVVKGTLSTLNNNLS